MPSKRRKLQTSGKGHTSGNSSRVLRPRKGRQQAAAAPTHVPASDSPPAVLQQPQQTAVDANDATMVAPATAVVVATTATTTTTTPAVSPSQSPVRQRPPVAWCYYGRHKHGAVLEQQTVGCLKEHIAHLERLSDTSSLTVHLDGQLLADDDALSESYLYDVGHVFPGTMKPTGFARLLLESRWVKDAKRLAAGVYASKRNKGHQVASSARTTLPADKEQARTLAAAQSETAARHMFSLAQFGVLHIAAFQQFGLLNPSVSIFDNPAIFTAVELPPTLAEVHAADGIAADNSRYRVEQRIGALAVGVPLPRRIITRLNQHARTHQAAAWRAVMLALNTFWHKMEAAPDMSCHFLNTDIFKAVLESLDPLVGVSAKDCLDRYRASFDARQPDITACLRNPLRRTDADITAALLASLHCPFFLAEVSGTRVTSADNHRDFDRLARNMTMCMLVWLGVLRHAPVAERATLRIYGALIGVSSVEFLCMRPVFGTDDRVALLLHTNKDSWSVSFDAMPQAAAPLLPATSDSSPTSKSVEAFPAVSAAVELDLLLAASMDERAFAESEGMNDHGQEDTSHGSMAFKRVDLANEQGHAQIAGLVRPIFAFASHLRGYSRRLYNLVNTTPELGDPYDFPADTLAPTNPWTRHGLSTGSNLTGSGSSDSEDDTDDVSNAIDWFLRSCKLFKAEQFSAPHGVKVIRVRNCAGVMHCAKHKPRGWSREIRMTRMVQGHPNIASLFTYKDMTDRDAGIVLVEELLFHDQSVLNSGSPTARLEQLVKYIRHGLSALEHLASLRVVHCDISPNNIMHSRNRQVWCIMDFGNAALIPASHTCISHSELLGTDSFIAPEAVEDQVYSIASDLWSFGATVLHVARDVLSVGGYFDNRTEAQKAVAAEIRAEIRRLMRDQPGNRAAASDVRQAFVKIQRDVDRLVNPQLAAQVEPMDGSQASAVAAE